MSRTQAISSLNPLRVITGAPVVTEDAQAAIEQLNWTYGYRPQLHLSLATGPDEWVTDAIGTLRLTFPSELDTWKEQLRLRIRINPDTVNVIGGFRCTFNGSGEGDVRMKIGSSSWASVSFTNGDLGVEKTVSIATADSGTGWQTVLIEIQRTAAGSGVEFLRNVRIQDEEITSGLPGPQDE